MAVTVNFPKEFKKLLGNAGIDLATADIRAIPLTDAYTFADTHQFASSLSGEVTTNGGTRLALTTESWALSGSYARFDCDDLVWTSSGTLVIRQVAIVNYEGSSGDSDREIICVLTNDADLTAASGLDIVWQTPSGLFEIR